MYATGRGKTKLKTMMQEGSSAIAAQGVRGDNGDENTGARQASAHTKTGAQGQMFTGQELGGDVFLGKKGSKGGREGGRERERGRGRKEGSRHMGESASGPVPGNAG